MLNENHLRILLHAIILIVLSIMLLIALGCDQSAEIPTSESLEITENFSLAESNGLISDTEVTAAPAAANTIPLNLFWNALSTDYLTIAQPIAPLGLPAQGHVFQGIVGRIFQSSKQEQFH